MTASRVLVVGVGSIGERHVRCFQRTGRVEVSICEINDQLRENVANRYAVDRSFDSWEAAVASDCDAAVICTPAHLHVAMAIDLAVAWSLFDDGADRDELLCAYGADGNARARARGWAVFFGLILVQAGLVNAPRHARQGRAILRRLAHDVKSGQG